MTCHTTNDKPRREKTDLPLKNRVGVFSSYSTTRARFFETQPLEPHQENPPTATKTVSGMRFYGYRYYSSEMGRWVSRDPIGELGGVNLYLITHNRMMDEYDVLGLSDNECGGECSDEKAEEERGHCEDNAKTAHGNCVDNCKSLSMTGGLAAIGLGFISTPGGIVAGWIINHLYDECRDGCDTEKDKDMERCDGISCDDYDEETGMFTY